MQFTVLIEFLVPGLATTLLLLFLLTDGTVPKLPQGLPTGETASALMLLAVSYPVGILTNFPLFQLQRRLVSAKVRERVFKKYVARNPDLEAWISKQLGITLSSPSADDREELGLVFHLMSAFVFSKNIERLHSNLTYHEGLQRLSRGILPPLLLASYVVWKNHTPDWPWLIGFFIFLAVWACYLVCHSVNVEYEQIMRYFLVLTNIEQRAAGRASATADGMPSVRA